MRTPLSLYNQSIRAQENIEQKQEYNPKKSEDEVDIKEKKKMSQIHVTI